MSDRFTELMDEHVDGYYVPLREWETHDLADLESAINEELQVRYQQAQEEYDTELSDDDY